MPPPGLGRDHADSHFELIELLDGDSFLSAHHDGIMEVYKSAHRERLHEPRMSPDSYSDRLSREHVRRPGFSAVVAQAAGRTMGYAYGCSGVCENGIRNEIHEAFSLEVAMHTPVFVFMEIAVEARWQRHRVGRRMHDVLLHRRLEEIARLLVKRDNVKAKQAYANWSWVFAGSIRPYAGVAVHDVMLRRLPASGTAPNPAFDQRT